MAHDHYASTGIDNLCNLCATARAYRPLVEGSAEAFKIDRERKVWRAQALRAEGKSLFAIATELGVTKEWLRHYAGIN